MIPEFIPVNELFESEFKNPNVTNSKIEPELKNEGMPTIENEILNTIIQKIKPVNFTELSQNIKKSSKAYLESSQALQEVGSVKLHNVQLLISCVENIIKVTNENKFGICKNQEFNYLYNGEYWSIVDSNEFKIFLGTAAEMMGVSDYIAKYYRFKEELLRQFSSTAYLSKPRNVSDAVKINLKNGTFEITPEGTNLKPFNPKDFLTYQLPFEFNPEAKAPIFQDFLDKVLPDIQSQKVLAEYLGYLFIKNGSKNLKEEKALILYGTGANGKSVISEIVNALLGKENVCSYSLESLTDVNGYYRAKLVDKLLNYASEISGKLEVSFFKQIVSGEPIQACSKYRDPIIIDQYAKMMFNCNELPKDVENNNAFFRRFLIIPFNITIPENEQDKQLHNKIIDNELSGVFNWVLEGLHRLLAQQHFTKCKAADAAVEEYKYDSDSVKQFLDFNGYVSNPSNYTSYGLLFNAYRKFCFDDGCVALKKNNFKRRLINQGYIIERKNSGYVIYLSVAELELQK